MTNDLPELMRRLSMDISRLSTQLRKVFSAPIVFGRLVSFTLPAGQFSCTAVHGLGRAYQGGFVVTADAAYPYVLAPPGDRADSTAQLLCQIAPTSKVNLLCWVF